MSYLDEHAFMHS